MRWRDYFLEKGRGLIEFWSEHLGERVRSVLLVLGRGFDPRSRLGLDMILAAGGVGGRDVLGLDYDEGEASPSLAYAQRVEENWTHIATAVQGRGTIELRGLPFWSGTRGVGPLHAANIFNLPEELTRYDDVVIDISTMPRGVYFPLIARILYLLDHAAAEATTGPTYTSWLLMTLHWIQGLSRRASMRRQASSIPWKEASAGRQQVSSRKSGFPCLGSHATIQFDRIYDLVKPDEICPSCHFCQESPPWRRYRPGVPRPPLRPAPA